MRRLAELRADAFAVLRRGWVWPARSPGPHCAADQATRGWERLSEAVSELAVEFIGWPSSAGIRRSRPTSRGSPWANGSTTSADAELRATAVGLRGFFLADPEELSLLALVDQFASTSAGAGQTYRIVGGNDRLAAVLAESLGERLQLLTELVAVSHRGRPSGQPQARRQLTQMAADYLPHPARVCAPPAGHAGAPAAAASGHRRAALRTGHEVAAAVLARSGGCRDARPRSDRRCHSAPSGTGTRSSAAPPAS